MGSGPRKGGGVGGRGASQRPRRGATPLSRPNALAAAVSAAMSFSPQELSNPAIVSAQAARKSPVGEDDRWQLPLDRPPASEGSYHVARAATQPPSSADAAATTAASTAVASKHHEGAMVFLRRGEGEGRGRGGEARRGEGQQGDQQLRLKIPRSWRWSGVDGRTRGLVCVAVACLLRAGLCCVVCVIWLVVLEGAFMLFAGQGERKSASCWHKNSSPSKLWRETNTCCAGPPRDPKACRVVSKLNMEEAAPPTTCMHGPTGRERPATACRYKPPPPPTRSSSPTADHPPRTATTHVPLQRPDVWRPAYP